MPSRVNRIVVIKGCAYYAYILTISEENSIESLVAEEQWRLSSSLRRRVMEI